MRTALIPGKMIEDRAPVTMVELDPCEPLFREGDDSDAVYVIDSGRVEVRVGEGESALLLAVCRRGEVLGEIGVVRRRPRSATVIAASAARLYRIEAQDFLEAFGSGDSVGVRILEMIANRMAETDAALGEDVWIDPPALERNVQEMRLFGDSPLMSRLIAGAGVTVDQLPFEVGCVQTGRAEQRAGRLTISLPVSESPIESRHFVIETDCDGRMQARDLKSRLGCIVNDRHISALGRTEEGPSTGLLPGDNTIVAGGIDSEVRFILRLQMKAAAAA